jgi:hypothetical protein
LKFAKQDSEATFSVKVRNLAYIKDVVVHYTADHITWKNQPFAWLAPTFETYDLFSGSINDHVRQFVIRYSVNGQTFYDNNSGHNYSFEEDSDTVGGNVTLYKATARQDAKTGASWLEGDILVNNVDPPKEVGIVMTADGGATWTTTQAQLASFTSDGKSVAPSEVWSFKTPESGQNVASNRFVFAVFYRDLETSIEYWDNNFGQNYQISKTNGAILS